VVPFSLGWARAQPVWFDARFKLSIRPPRILHQEGVRFWVTNGTFHTLKRLCFGELSISLSTYDSQAWRSEIQKSARTHLETTRLGTVAEFKSGKGEGIGATRLQGYLAHKKQPPPLGPP